METGLDVGKAIVLPHCLPLDTNMLFCGWRWRCLRVASVCTSHLELPHSSPHPPATVEQSYHCS